MFRGVHNINMDAKGRLAMPARQREPLMEQCGGQIVVTVEPKSLCLVIYPLPEWERIERDLQSLPALKPGVKRLQRQLLGYATDLELDTNGRILLPPSLREYARLEKKLVLVGQANKFELWAEPLWLAEVDEPALDPDAGEELAEEVLSLQL
ncbi:MAG: division/cell wall cluster transcriptional repressor MraZ [Halioglobus sp.]|nr:division/cell wall cluster transcriptional repressor MraZ [Halioglobus sp.]